MKPLLFIPVLAFCAILVNANPIAPPPALGELVLNQDGFSLELSLYMWGVDNLDNMRLVTSSSQASFNPGIIVNWEELLVVTEEDLQNTLNIDPEGDFIIIEENYGSTWYEIDRIYFGNQADSWVSSPLNGESIIKQEFNFWGELFYWTVKNKPPSLGSSAYQTYARGIFFGYVLDKFNRAVPGAWIKYCNESYYWGGAYPSLEAIFTDSTGYFFCDNMFARKYAVDIIINDKLYWNDNLVIELDSNNYYEFIIDSLAVGLSWLQELPSFNISNYPNPFTSNTTIDITLPAAYHWSSARITIMDMSGKVVDQIDGFNSFSQKSINANWHASAELNSGIYIYTLELDNKRIASNKMILLHE